MAIARRVTQKNYDIFFLPDFYFNKKKKGKVKGGGGGGDWGWGNPKYIYFISKFDEMCVLYVLYIYKRRKELIC